MGLVSALNLNLQVGQAPIAFLEVACHLPVTFLLYDE